MDEYERAARELVRVVERVSEEDFETIRDPHTADESCRSIQTIMAHVVRAGYGYAEYIREALGMAGARPEAGSPTRDECLRGVEAFLAYTASVLDGRWQMSDDEIMAVRIHARWGPEYDLEQMLEHAIVHVLRHRRQIERFLARAASA
jgi:uncharacterized damage-inducible protein DinB